MSFDLESICIYVSVNSLLIYQAFEYVNIFEVFRKFLKRHCLNTIPVKMNCEIVVVKWMKIEKLSSENMFVA